MKNTFLYDREHIPTREHLEMLMGEAFTLREELYAYLSESVGTVEVEWKFYSKKSGWTSKTLLGNRNLFFLSPMEGTFMVTFIFGDRAAEAVLKGAFPDHVKQSVESARKYAEGRGISLEIQNRDDLKIVRNLIDIKIKN